MLNEKLLIQHLIIVCHLLVSSFCTLRLQSGFFVSLSKFLFLGSFNFIFPNVLEIWSDVFRGH